MTRNLLIFYSLVSIPLMALAVGIQYELISSVTFVSLLIGYAFIYHPFVSGLRLSALGILDQKNFWRTFIPFWNTKYFRALFF